MARKIKCYVSFSSTDCNRADISFFLKGLRKGLESLHRGKDSARKGLESKVDFKVYFEQRVGSDLQRFMSEDLNSADAIIILFTPDYKRKCESGKPSGVHTEYFKITDRMDRDPYGDKLLIMPILWRGESFESSLPDMFINRNLSLDLRQFRAYGSDDRERYLPSNIESNLRPDLESLFNALDNHWAQLDPEQRLRAKEIEKVLMDDAVIAGEQTELISAEATHEIAVDPFSVKYERSGVPIDAFYDHYFTNTEFFRSIGQFHRFAFAGRKGSGKTTLIKMYQYANKDKYFHPIDVEVNDWNLHYILGDLHFKQAQGDFRYQQPESKVFDFIWAVFLCLSMVRSLLETENIPRDRITACILPPRYRSEFVRTRTRNDELFKLSIDFVKYFIQNAIDSSSTESEDQFKRDLNEKINVENCTELLLGKDYSSIIELLTSYSQGRKFLRVFRESSGWF
jgi:hypothetical protein